MLGTAGSRILELFNVSLFLQKKLVAVSRFGGMNEAAISAFKPPKLTVRRFGKLYRVCFPISEISAKSHSCDIRFHMDNGVPMASFFVKARSSFPDS
jgi:hypothetical protein